GVVRLRSKAALYLARHLRWPWRFLYWMRWLPAFLGDLPYRLVAALRYRLFGKKESAKDLVIIGLCLTAGMVFVLYGGILMSTYWAGIVILVMSAIGLVSNESYQDKLVTMASTAQGAGLICTLFGLGLLIGPAIAQRDIEAIGFGIYVKIEPTITGLALSIILNMLFGYEARRKRI
nr:DCC1-like thiol-disulfide oxidoreductase family protein [bacterium]